MIILVMKHTMRMSTKKNLEQTNAEVAVDLLAILIITVQCKQQILVRKPKAVLSLLLRRHTTDSPWSVFVVIRVVREVEVVVILTVIRAVAVFIRNADLMLWDWRQGRGNERIQVWPRVYYMFAFPGSAFFAACTLGLQS